jgi:hypothetical protein
VSGPPESAAFPPAALAADKNERTTAQGLFNYGDAYLASAHSLRASKPNVVFADAPVRFLLYQAAELHLKAFLRCAGLDVNDLEKKGHQFTKLIAAARDFQLGLDRGCEGVLVYGQRTGDVIGSRYIVTGFRRWFETEDLGKSAASVRRAVRLHSLRLSHIVLRGERDGIVDDHWERAWGIK